MMAEYIQREDLSDGSVGKTDATSADSGFEIISSIASLYLRFMDSVSILACSFTLSTTLATIAWSISGG